VLILFGLGYLRDQFIINLVNPGAGMLLSRESMGAVAYPTHLSAIERALFNNPQWISTTIFFLLYALFTAACIYLVFFSRKAVKLTLLIYLLIIAVCAILIIGGYFFGTSIVAYQIAQSIKNVGQSPIILMILIPAIKMYRDLG